MLTRNLFARATRCGLLIVACLIASPSLALAHEIYLEHFDLHGPGWQYDYDLSSSFIEVEVCLGDCETEVFLQGPGSMSLYLEDPDGDQLIEDGANARLFDFTLETRRTIIGLITQTTIELEDGHRGSFDAVGVGVDWNRSPGPRVHIQGTSVCPAGELCELSYPPTPPNPPIMIDEISDLGLSRLQYNFGVTPPDALMQAQLDVAGLSSIATATLFVVGQETRRSRCTAFLVVDTHITNEPGHCRIPEPNAPMLTLLGLGALLGARWMQRRRDPPRRAIDTTSRRTT